MTPTPADLAAAMKRCRGVLSANIVDTENMPPECVDDLLTIAHWLAENAERLRVVRPLEWVDLRDMSYAKCIDGNCYLVWNDSWQSPGNPTAHACDSLTDGKAKAQAWYDERIAAALAPAFPAKAEQS